MALDARGDISAAIIAVYVPVLIISLFVTFRHGFSRKGGWLSMVILSITRIVGASLHIAAEQTRPVKVGLFIGYFVLEGAGLAPLLLATTEFLGTISERAFDQDRIVTTGLRLMYLLGLACLGLNIAGGTQASGSNPSKGSTLRHVSVILYAVFYVLIVLVHFRFWAHRDQIMKHRRNLLIGISAALPFLLVRVVYSVLSGFAPPNYGQPSSNTPSNSLSKFNTSGPWEIWLFMAVLPELGAVLVYVVAGLKTPLAKDYDSPADQREWSGEEDKEMMLPAGDHRVPYSDPYTGRQ